MQAWERNEEEIASWLENERNCSQSKNMLAPGGSLLGENENLRFSSRWYQRI